MDLLLFLKMNIPQGFLAFFLFINDQIITYDINIKAIIIPGIIPAINNFAIDS